MPEYSYTACKMINPINLGHSKNMGQHTPSGFDQKTRADWNSDQNIFVEYPTLKCLTDYLEIDFRSCLGLMRFLNFWNQKAEYNSCFWGTFETGFHRTFAMVTIIAFNCTLKACSEKWFLISTTMIIFNCVSWGLTRVFQRPE